MLPPSISDLVETIGLKQTLTLISAAPKGTGGRPWRVNLYVPQKLHAEHFLVRVLGWDDAERMVDRFGGYTLQPSNCNWLFREYRNGMVRNLRNEGATSHQIADAVGISERQVRNILAEKAPQDLSALLKQAADAGIVSKMANA